jgi:hypothetical protein
VTYIKKDIVNDVTKANKELFDHIQTQYDEGKKDLAAHEADDVRHVIQADKDNWNSAESNAKTYATTREALEKLEQHGSETHRSGKDANGKFTTVEIKRQDGTLFMKSVLSGTVDANGNYPTRTETFYAGTTEIGNIIYSRTFDADGDLLTEVF